MRTADDGHVSGRDRWAREIELQKAFGFTPSEASTYTSYEQGESVADIASSAGLSVQTVKNVLTNARRKLSGGGSMEIYIIRPHQRDDGTMIRMYAVDVLLQFLMRAMTDVRVDYLTHVIRVSGLSRSVPGDVAWMNANVFRYIDLTGLRGREDPTTRAERIMEVYREKLPTPSDCMMGFAVVKYWLDQNYVNYDIMEGI